MGHALPGVNRTECGRNHQLRKLQENVPDKEDHFWVMFPHPFSQGCGLGRIRTPPFTSTVKPQEQGEKPLEFQFGQDPSPLG
jgi:hypothetical protein